jgi:phage replication-related protein YjqB (UPF0714/DUF867 family)
VDEDVVLRSRFGFMAFHGGAMEQATDLIAAAAAEAAGASYYGVVHPSDQAHFPSIEVDRRHSSALDRFLDHVEVVVTVHGFGRAGYFTSLLLGGRNRSLADHLAGHLRQQLPAYDIVTQLENIPVELRGLHERNPVNRPPAHGVQIELPPRVRGASPLWWDWEGPGPVPHTRRLIAALAGAARSWPAERIE